MNVNEKKKTKESLVERAARKLADNKQAPDIQSQTKAANGELVKPASYSVRENKVEPTLKREETSRENLKEINPAIKIDHDRLNEKN
ncbi:MAG TPA: hypothetical protein PLM34_02815, partial [Lentimicrobium sp.]|nr:hypothetical protein [Lentimicrobium sp.]